MQPTNDELIRRALATLTSEASPVIAAAVTPPLVPGVSWTELLRLSDAAKGRGGNKIYEESDPQCVLRALTEELPKVGRPFAAHGARMVPAYASELRHVRNRVAHGGSFSDDEAMRGLDTIERLLAELGSENGPNSIQELKAVLVRGLAPTPPSHGGEISESPVESVADEIATVESDGETVAPPDDATESLRDISIEALARPTLSWAMANSGIAPVQSVRITNSGSDSLDVTLQISIDTNRGRISRDRVIPITLPAGEAVQLSNNELNVQLDAVAMQNIDEHITGVTEIRLLRAGEVLASRAQSVEVLAARQWWMRGGESAAALLAAHVMPNDPAVGELVREANAILSASTNESSWDGYLSENPNRVDAMVRAIFEALQARSVTYMLPPAGWSDAGQKVRTPDEVINGQAGTCLDTTVVLAAALEFVGLHPLLFVVKGHAFLGYWRFESSLNSSVTNDIELVRALIDRGHVQVVETTMVCTSSPYAEGSQWSGVIKEPVLSFIAPADAPDSFQSMIDIRRARADRIAPLPAKSLAADGTITLTEYRAAEHGAAPVAVRAARARAERDGEVPARVTLWKNSLLDLSLRNRLLNFGIGRSNHAPIATPPGSLSRIEDLVNADVPLKLLPHDQLSAVERERGLRVASELDDEFFARELEDGRTLYTAIPADNYLSAMRGLAYKSRSSVQETGANNLYLAFGLLQWTPKDYGKTISSPLILVPVKLESQSRGRAYRIVLDETGESTPNYCLLEKLKVEYDLHIPGLENPAADDSGIDLDAAFSATRAAIAQIDPSFRVEPVVNLAILEFSKFRMWKDLDENWQQLASNSLVNHLIETPTLEFSDPALPAAEEGAHLAVEDAAESRVNLDSLNASLPVAADASQVQAVADAIAGKTFLLEGPPGTGKSQTITNMLARAMVEGRKVLFVAEKAEALKVVKKRLDAVGLGVFTLDAHDKASKPAEVRRQLLEALDYVTEVDKVAFERAALGIDSSTRVLTRYADRLHAENSAGYSLHSARQAQLAADANVPAMPIPLPLLTDGDDTAFGELATTMRSLSEAVGGQKPSPQHPWRFVDARPSEIDQPSFLAAARQLDLSLDKTAQVSELTQLLAAVVRPAEIESITALLRAPQLLLADIDTARTSEWNEQTTRIVAAVAAFAAHPHPQLALVLPEVLDLDLNAIHAESLAADATGFFGRKKRRLAVKQKLASALRPQARVKLSKLTEFTASLHALMQEVASLRSEVLAISGLDLPANWNPLIADGSAQLRTRIDWVRWACYHTDPARAAEEPLVVAIRDFFSSLSVVDAATIDEVTALQTALHSVVNAGNVNDVALTNWRIDDGILTAWAKARIIRGNVDDVERSFRAWVRILEALEPLAHHGLGDARNLILDGDIRADDAVISYSKGLAEHSVVERTSAASLDDFDGTSHQHSIDRFRLSLGESREYLPQAMAAQLLAGRTFKANSISGQIGLLRRELEKQRRGLSVRALMAKFGPIITSVTPCIMMSPGSVARFFPAQADLFDVVVFDEASQLRVADAIGAMGRGTSVIIVGDSNQMPPTSVAQSAISMGDDDADDDEVVEDQESILTEGTLARVPSRTLTWHYRSQDESLIAFSNQRYYKGHLSSFPTPLFGTRDDGPGGYGISFRRIDGEYRPAGRRASSTAGGTLPANIKVGTQTNLIEAQAISTEIVRRFELSPDKWPSIGVVTFNMNQRKLIDDLLRESGNDRVTDALDDDDGIFVKNLESVQGDERDEIFFSVGRSADRRGNIGLNFGPLNQRGGERRLNVAVTRARRQVVMFCSFDPAQLKAEQSQSIGLNHLKQYLILAERGSEHAASDPMRRSVTDLHRSEIAAALEERGYVVTCDIGLSEFRIDLSIATASEPERPIAAVLLDGPSWAQRLTVADRDALPLDVLLKLMNWPTVARIWLPDWLRDRDSVIDRLVHSIEHGHANDEHDSVAGESVLALTGDDDRHKADELAAGGSPEIGLDSLSERLTSRSAGESVDVASALDGLDRGESGSERAASNTFVAWDPRVVGQVDVLDGLPRRESTERVRQMIVEIIHDEGPIHYDRLARLTASAFGLMKVSGKRSAAILRCVPDEYRGPDGEPFAWPPSIDSTTWRGFRGSSDGESRPIEHISPREIVNAMSQLCIEGMGMTEVEVKRETLNRFGGRRMTAGIEQMLDDALKLGLELERLMHSDGLIHPTENLGERR